ncbi:hypothetical protein ANCCAN_00257 [Ancylostoma caninum]|uniref:Uncharacterized protein n=1 Tax=Ancylostoma caninum TaxID=29170 RepID=A0A368HAY0_ANCCA|nr:hypothetical protein ANCCAN_00257 [Ancylostoma caninum]
MRTLLSYGEGGLLQYNDELHHTSNGSIAVAVDMNGTFSGGVWTGVCSSFSHPFFSPSSCSYAFFTAVANFVSTPAKEEEEVLKKAKVKDAPIPVPVPVEKNSQRKLPEPPPENKRYETEQPTAILPPPATVTQPVFVPIPVHDRRESLVKEVEREIRIVAPPKPETVDVGVNTDPWPIEKKRKAKKIDKVQVRQAPVIHSPLVEVDGDLGDDVSVHLERWHSAETVLPKGDVADNTPFVFIRNPKPKGTPKEPPRATSAPFVVEPDEQEQEKPQKDPPVPAGMPRRFRSPPPAENSAPPSKRTIRSPPTAKRPGPQLRRIPSPPKENVERGGSEEKIPEETIDSAPQIPPKRTRSQREVQRSVYSRMFSEASVPFGGRPHSNRPSRPPGSAPEPTGSSSPTLPRGNVSMRNPRGRMGGAVRAGGGGGATPVGWKPWANGSSSQSQHQQFLNVD